MFATEFSQRVFWTLDRPDTVRSLLIFKLPPFLQRRSVWILQVTPHNISNISTILRWLHITLTSSVIARQFLTYQYLCQSGNERTFEKFYQFTFYSKNEIWCLWSLQVATLPQTTSFSSSSAIFNKYWWTGITYLEVVYCAHNSLNVLRAQNPILFMLY